MAPRAGVGGRREAALRAPCVTPLTALVLRSVMLVGGAAVAGGLCSEGLVPQPDCANCEWRSGQSVCVQTAGVATGAVCVAVCQAGFGSSGSTSETFTCGADGSFAATAGQEIQCTAHQVKKGCLTAPPCEGQGCEWSGGCTAQRGISCTARCRAGFFPGAVGNHPQVKYTYSGQGQRYAWEVPKKPLMCELACSNLPPHPHQRWRTGVGYDNACAQPPHSTCTCKEHALRRLLQLHAGAIRRRLLC